MNLSSGLPIYPANEMITVYTPSGFPVNLPAKQLQGQEDNSDLITDGTQLPVDKGRTIQDFRENPQVLRGDFTPTPEALPGTIPDAPSKFKTGVAGLSLLAGGIGISNGVREFKNSEGIDRARAGADIVSGAGSVVEGAADLSGIADDVITRTASGVGRFASHAGKASQLTGVASKLGTFAKVAGPAGALVGGGFQVLSGGMGVIGGIKDYKNAVTEEEKSAAKHKIVSGSLDGVSGGLGLAAGVCLATGVGAPVAAVLGAASLGVQGVKFLYDHGGKIVEKAKEFGGKIADGAKSIGNAISGGLKTIFGGDNREGLRAPLLA